MDESLVRRIAELLTERDDTRTVAHLLVAWRSDGWPAWSRATRKAYGRHVDLIGQRLGRCLLSELDGTHAEELRAWVTAKSGEAQAGLVVNALKTVARFGVATGWLSVDPLRRVRRVQSRARDRAFTYEQVVSLDQELAKLADPHWGSPAAAARVVLWTGERESAIRGLRWCDVHLSFRALQLPAQKRKGPRVRPIPEPAIRVLEEQRARHPGELVFPGRRGHVAPVSYATVHRLWNAALESIGVEPCGFHVARHTVASLLADAGATNAELMELLGWASPQIPARYTRVRPERLRALVRHASGEEK